MSKECRNPECVRYRDFSFRSNDNFCGQCGGLLAFASLPSSVGFDGNAVMQSTSLFKPREMQILKRFCVDRDISSGRGIPQVGKRACISCNNKRKCIPSESENCCQYCFGKSMYCEGPIDTPQLWNPPYRWAVEIDTLSSRYRLLENVMKDGMMFSLLVKLDTSIISESTHITPGIIPGMSPVYDIDLRHLNQDQSFVGESLKDVLDMIFAVSAQTETQADDSWSSSIYSSYGSYKNHCQRFIVCSMLLSRPQLCMLSSDIWNLPAAPFIVLEVLRQLSHSAYHHFHKFFEELRAILGMRRARPHGNLMSLLAFHMGMAHGAVEILGLAASTKTSRNLMMPKFDTEIQIILDYLRFLGRGFDSAKNTTSNSFEEGTKLAASIMLPKSVFMLCDRSQGIGEEKPASFPDVYTFFTAKR